MNHYQKALEDFRHHYYIKYGVRLDDEILYFFIRINEMQLDLKKDIKATSEIRFRNSGDYFMYGLGKVTYPLIIFFISVIISFIVLYFLLHK